MSNPVDLLQRATIEPIILPVAPTDPHVMLSNTNGYWRDAMLATSKCWDTFIFSTRPVVNPQQLLADFYAFVGRSASRPLSITVVTDTLIQTWAAINNPQVRDRVYGSGTIGVLNDIIHPYLNRIRHLHLTISRAENSPFLLDLSLQPFGAVEVVDSDFFDNVDLPYFTNAQSLEPFSPLHLGRICRIILTGRLNPLRVELQWPSITRFDLSGTALPPGVIVEMMGRTRHSLVDTSFRIGLDTTSTRLEVERHNLKRIKMDCLVNLHVHFENLSFYPRFILLFEADGLRKVWLEHTEPIASFQLDIPMYSSWLSNSTNSLESLILVNHISGGEPSYVDNHRSASRRQTSEDLIGLFTALPKLKHLRLPFNISIHQPVFIAMFQRLPFLQAVEVTTDADPKLVFNIIQSRNVFPRDPSRCLWIPAPILFAHLKLTRKTSIQSQTDLAIRAAALKLRFGCTVEFV